MANEFIARNGIISLSNIQITGSLNVTGGITGSISGIATTASYVNLAQTASYNLQATSASVAVTASVARNPVSQGITGRLGTQGPAGNVGTQGGNGIIGIQGTGGPTGTTAAQGRTGTQGSTGTTVQGTQGANSSTGDVGTIGAQGRIGTTGPTGTVAGPTGPTGPTGTTGPGGPTGPLGGVGPTGSPGPTGPPGTPGRTGTTGPPGPTGPTGPYASNASGNADYAMKFTGATSAGNSLMQDNGTACVVSNYITMYVASGPAGRVNIVKVDSGNPSAIACYHSGTYTGGMDYSNTATQFITSSDYRLKYDLKDFNGLSLLSRIKVYDFAWKLDDTRSYGVVAHELQEIIPDAVTGEKDRMGSDGNMKPQGVDYSKIVPILVKATQELQEIVTQLKNK